MSAICRIFLFTFVCVLSAAGQIYQGRALVEPRLIADTASLEAGKPFRVGVLLKMAEGWHTYWKYPGDSGQATKIDWTLPPGFTVGDLQWPTPEVENEAGDLQVYVYKGETLLFATVTPPKGWKTQNIEIAAKASWLVCEKLCVPGQAELKLPLPASPEAALHHQATFEKFTRLLPSNNPPTGLVWKKSGKDLLLSVPKPSPETKSAFFFPNPPADVLVGHPVTQLNAETIEFRIPLLDGSAPATELSGVIQVDSQSWEIAPPTPKQSVSPTPVHTSTLTLLPALLFGFLGGLILNLMPCVLPVISLKMFSFVKQAGESRKRIFQLGLAFAGGMFAWFLGLAVVLLLVRSSGADVSWAQQFQNPWFNMGICVVIFLFALNLLGVYEITLPGSATTRLAATGDSGNGLAGAFSQGMFATILGTPCTAPYLGTTLAFALTQPPFALIAVFASIAFGMSAPYLLLCANPGWMRYLPKPGLWMVRLKEFMGFLLLATLLWFIWIVGRQLGVDAVVFLGSILLLCGLGSWIYGTFLTPTSSTKTRALAALGILLILGTMVVMFTSFRPVREKSTKPGHFSQALGQALATDRIVFVDFTADWCLSCKVNKRVAIDSVEVQKLFREKNVLFLEADWTNGDPEITRVLKQNGRAGVPLYLVYPTDRSRPAQLLPELLTPGIIVDALQQN